MEYNSRLGTICYYDFQLYRPLLCEPSLIFLFGVEAALANNSSSNLVLSKQSIPEIFNKAYYYLYGTYPQSGIDDIVYNCHDFKNSLNTLTGTDTSRVVPLIYHDSFCYRVIDDFNEEAQKFLKIFNYAGYSVKDSQVHYLGTFGITDPGEISAIESYNESLKRSHEEKQLYSQIYKSLDYKSVYSYALGVLYGCQALGYTFDWNSTNVSWYDGEYQNLITTAVVAFNFHNNHAIPYIDNDPHLYRKYKGIQINKIWNYELSC